MGTSELEKVLENNSKSIDQLKEDLRQLKFFLKFPTNTLL